MAYEGPRNSPVRAFLSDVTNRTARSLIKVFPHLTADTVTYTGLLAVIAGSAVKILPKELLSSNIGSPLSLGLMFVGSLCDAFDGAVARNKEKPPNYSALDGALTDVIHNRFGESAMALSRIISASARKDAFGVVAATISGLTAPLPSLLRAMVEEKGYYVPESGANPISFLGTRAARAVSGMLSTSYPDTPILGIPMQNSLDSITAFGNIAATIERLIILKKAYKNKLETNTDEDAKELGRVKANRLKVFTFLNTATLLSAGIIGLITL